MSERLVDFGHEGHLCGTLASPDGASTGLGVVMVNAGVIHRIGPHRIYVKLSRRLARSGHTVLRFDLAGSGDSRAPAKPAPMMEQVSRDIRDAIDLAQTQPGVQRIVLLGICSGAMNAFRTALQDERVQELVMFDGNMYPTWKTWALRQLGRLHWRALLRAAQVLRGGVTAGQAQGAAIDALDMPGSSLGRLPIAEYTRGMQALVARGVTVRLIFSGSFPAYYNHASQFADRFRGTGLPQAVRTAFLPHVDHVITLRSSQRVFIDLVDGWLRR